MLTLELEPELELYLKTIAEKEHRTINEIVNQLIKEYLNEKQNSELMQKRD